MNYLQVKRNLEKKSQYIEEKLLSALVVRPKRVSSILSLVSPKNFSMKRNQDAFQAIIESVTEEQSISYVMRKYGVNISEFTSAEELVNIEKTASDLANVSQLFSLLDNLQQGIEDMSQNHDLVDVVSKIQQAMADVENPDRTAEDAESILKVFEDEQKEYAELREQGYDLIGQSTGFSKLDKTTDGLRKGHFIVFGGYTSSGKTFFALNILASLLYSRKKSLFFTLEMTTTEIMARLLGILSGVNSVKLYKGILEERENQYVVQAKEDVRKSKLSILRAFTLEQIELRVYEEKMRGDVGVVFIDYMQLVTTESSENEYDTMRVVSMRLQELAQKTGVTIVALSQVSNESARMPDKRVIGFKGSGAIAASSDLSAELYVDEDMDELDRKKQIQEPFAVKLAIRKNRHGGTGNINYEFNTKNGQFREAIRAVEPPKKKTTPKQRAEKDFESL